MKRLNKQFKLADDNTIICNHKGDKVLADNGIYNLGICTLWLCTQCSARVRDFVLTNVLTDAAKLTLRGDAELQQLLKQRLYEHQGLGVTLTFTPDEIETIKIALATGNGGADDSNSLAAKLEKLRLA